jgi:DNA-damage-inducible protein D
MDKAVLQIQQLLESIKKMTAGDDPIEYWLGRDLMPLLGYSTWQKFSEAIDRAKEACKTVGYPVDNYFSPAPVKSTGGRPKEDYLLTRYACYLIVQNGDPRKPQIALAQTYFASQTRKQELLELREAETKRLEARAQLKDTEQKIESTVYQRGITLPAEFASFKNKHIEALYGGLKTQDLKRMRKIPTGRSLADFDSNVELSAKDFALAMTDHNIKAKNIQGKDSMNAEVVKNSAETRQALLNRGIVPEQIKPEEDLRQIEARRQKEIKELRKEPLPESSDDPEQSSPPASKTCSSDSSVPGGRVHGQRCNPPLLAKDAQSDN